MNVKIIFFTYKMAAFVSVSNLMNTLKSEQLIKQSDIQLNVYFDQFFENSKYKHNWTIKPIDFEVIDYKRNTRHLSYAEFRKHFSETEWINIGKQLNKYFKEFDKTPILRKLMILVRTKPFHEFEYHPLKITLTDIKQDSYENLKKERAAINDRAEPKHNAKEDSYDDLFID